MAKKRTTKSTPTPKPKPKRKTTPIHTNDPATWLSTITHEKVAVETPPATNAPSFPENEPFRTSENIQDLMTALLAFQNELRIINHDREGYGYTYATLGNIVETAQPVLFTNGLCLTQFPTSSGSRVGIVSLLTHTKSGQWLRSGFTFALPKIAGANDAQNAGAVITYARRYALTAILGLVAEEDLDAA